MILSGKYNLIMKTHCLKKSKDYSGEAYKTSSDAKAYMCKFYAWFYYLSDIRIQFDSLYGFRLEISSDFFMLISVFDNFLLTPLLLKFRHYCHHFWFLMSLRIRSIVATPNDFVLSHRFYVLYTYSTSTGITDSCEHTKSVPPLVTNPLNFSIGTRRYSIYKNHAGTSLTWQALQIKYGKKRAWLREIMHAEQQSHTRSHIITC